MKNKNYYIIFFIFFFPSILNATENFCIKVLFKVKVLSNYQTVIPVDIKTIYPVFDDSLNTQHCYVGNVMLENGFAISKKNVSERPTHLTIKFSGLFIKNYSKTIGDLIFNNDTCVINIDSICLLPNKIPGIKNATNLLVKNKNSVSFELFVENESETPVLINKMIIDASNNGIWSCSADYLVYDANIVVKSEIINNDTLKRTFQGGMFLNENSSEYPILGYMKNYCENYEFHFDSPINIYLLPNSAKTIRLNISFKDIEKLCTTTLFADMGNQNFFENIVQKAREDKKNKDGRLHNLLGSYWDVSYSDIKKGIKPIILNERVHEKYSWRIILGCDDHDFGMLCQFYDTKQK